MAKARILLVDDEVSLTQMVKLNLEATGNYEVQVENQGSLAVETAYHFRPDLIFLDLIMPDAEGSEIAKKIRLDSNLKNVPIIFFTATITSQEQNQPRGVAGGETLLAKPVSLKQLIGCIEQHLGKNRR